MATFIYNRAKLRLGDGSLDLDTDTIKALLITGSTTANRDDDSVATVLAGASEANGTGYTAGPGSSSRKTLTITGTVDDANDRADFATNSQTWTALNLGSTIKAVLIYEHVSGSDDALNFPIAWIDDASGLPLTTNGSDVTLNAQTIRIA